jgi:hypothetical protein
MIWITLDWYVTIPDPSDSVTHALIVVHHLCERDHVISLSHHSIFGLMPFPRLNLGAGSTTIPPALDDLADGLGSASELALRSGCTSDILLILQASLHRIVASAMGENNSAAKGAPPIPKGREGVLHFISTVHMFLTRLGEWEIEFYSISCEFIVPIT